MRSKVAAALALAALTTLEIPAAAEERGNQLLYNYSLRCFVAGSVLVAQLKRNGEDADAVEAADRGARTAYDAAFQVGGKLGFTKRRVTADLDSFQRTEQRRLILESGYMDATRADCAKLNFMPIASN